MWTKKICGTTNILGRGEFSLVFIVYSGVKPCDKASSDGETIKMLGYKWTTESDLLSVGLGELNLDKKIRGSKKPNLTPVCSRHDAEKLLKSITLNRRTILVKLQSSMLPLKGLDWDEKSPQLEKTKWSEI